MTVEEVKELMGSSKTEKEWVRNCDKVKAACGGYPEFWYEEVIASGLAGTTLAKFGRDDKIHFAPVKLEEL